MKSVITILTVVAMLGLWACNSSENRTAEASVQTEREQLAYGEDICEFTGKTIEVVRYGGRLITNAGDTLNFMSAECLAGYLLKMDDRDEVASLKAVDFVDGKRLMPVEGLKFLNSKLRPSPNGMYITAVDASNEKMLEFVYDAYPGTYLEWDELLKKVDTDWYSGSENSAMK